MGPERYVALLRGINVGGNNIIRMADLRACFEGLGLLEVTTYIQSGNVVFSSEQAGFDALVDRIERALSEAFEYESRVVLVSASAMARVAGQAPSGFGASPDRYRYDVLFPRPPVTTAEVLPQISARPDVDTVSAGEHALYFRRLTDRASQSHLSKIVSRPVYRHLTIRNWNTTSKLLAMLTSRTDPA